jgi:hypothetical protein
LVDEHVINRDFYFRLRHELDGVLGAAIDLRMAALPAEASNFGDGDSLHSDVADGLANVVKLERFDYRGNELHNLRGRKHHLCQPATIEHDQRVRSASELMRAVLAPNQGGAAERTH